MPSRLEDARRVLGLAPGVVDADEVRRAYKLACLRWHPDKSSDPDAERMFQEVQTAFNMLSVDFDATEALAATEDFVSNLPSVEPSSKPADAGRTKLRIGSDGVLFLGSVLNGQPNGAGQLILKDGSVHHGMFENGRATGAGLFYAANGAIFRGVWVQSRRVGPFEVIDPKGGRWHDLYDESGKRVRRTQAVVKAMAAAASELEQAKQEAAAAEAEAAGARAAVAAAAAAVANAAARQARGDCLSNSFERLTPEQRRAAAERNRLRGAAVRAERRLAEGGGFAGVSPLGSPVTASLPSSAAPSPLPDPPDDHSTAEAGEPADAPAADVPAGGVEAGAVEGDAVDAEAEAEALMSVVGTSLFSQSSEPSAALLCRRCSVRFHPALSSLCRRHHMEWMSLDVADLGYSPDEFPEGGMWQCCGRTSKASEGCAIGAHEAQKVAARAEGAQDGGE